MSTNSASRAPLDPPAETEQFRLFAEALPQMAWMASADGEVFWYNQRWYEFTGTDPAFMQGRGWTAVHHPVTLPSTLQRWQDSLASQTPLEIEIPLGGKDGVYRWFLTRVTPVRDASGEVRIWVGTNTDITETREMREELRAFRDRLQICTEGVELGIWFCDLPFDTLHWTPRVKQHFGLPPDAPITIQTFYERLHPDDREPTRNAIARAIDNSVPYDIEYRTIGLDGELRWIRAIGACFRDENGVPRRFDGVTLDITRRKSAEDDRKRLELREHANAERTTLLSKIGLLLTAELDTQKLTQRVTDLATQLTGAQFGAFFHNVVDSNQEKYMLYTLSGVPKESFSRFPMPRNTDLFGATFRGEGVLRSGDIQKDYRYGKNAPHYGMPKGHLPVCSYLAVPVISRSGDVLGGLFFGHSEPDRFSEEHEQAIVAVAAQAAVALDNAQLFQQANDERQRTREALTALQRSNEELRRANADLERFAYSASHDLREPIRMVSLFCQLLQERYEGRLDSDADSYIAQAVQGAYRMEVLVRDLLQYTQATAGAGEIVTTPVDARKVLNHALDSLRDIIEKSGATVMANGLPRLPIHEVHLHQIFQNLIGNAIKYRSKHAPRINVWATREGESWKIAIQDNGIGIEPRYHERIFELFQRLHGKDEYEGTGIGLAVCQKLVARYGGRIWVESELGQGSTFFISLPGGDF